MTRDELVEVLRAEQAARASVPPWLQLAGASVALLVGLVTLGGGAVAAVAAAAMASAELADLAGEVTELRTEVSRMRLEVAERTGDRWSRSDHQLWVRDEFRPALDELRAELRALERRTP